MDTTDYQVLKTDSRKLLVALTDEELARKGETMASKETVMRAQKEALKEYSKNEKAEIAIIDGEIKKIAEEISYGKESRDVKCETRLLTKSNTVITVRLDTGETIGERNATDSEKQGGLFDEAAATADEALGSPDDVIAAVPVSDEEFEASKKTALPPKRSVRKLNAAPIEDGDAA